MGGGCTCVCVFGGCIVCVGCICGGGMYMCVCVWWVYSVCRVYMWGGDVHVCVCAGVKHILTSTYVTWVNMTFDPVSKN